MRKHGHEKANAERKLTDEQRREKKENKKLDEEKRGIFGAVYKCVFLSLSLLPFSLLSRVRVLTAHFAIVFVGSRSSATRHTNSKYAKTRTNSTSPEYAFSTPNSTWST
jgi:hypothetical protein